MNDKRKLRLMQEALDGELSEEGQQEHSLLLETDLDYAERFDPMERVDMLLQAAPHERAPERLALTIMARLATAVRPHPRLRAHPELSEEMVQTAVQLVTIAALPMLVGAGWMMLNAQNDPEALEAVLYHVAILLTVVMDVMEIVIEKAQEIFPSDPDVAMALLAMLPSLLLAVIQQVMESAAESNGNGPS